jgi:hypothetical protein
VKPGPASLDAVVEISRGIDTAARNGNAAFGIRVTVTYLSQTGTIETLDSGPKSIKDDTVLIDVDNGTAIFQLTIPYGTVPPPSSSNPNYSVTAEILPPGETVT